MKSIYIIPGLALVSNLSFAQTKNFIDQPYVETTAIVDTSVTPDKIFLTILITESDTKGKLSVEELEAKMAATLEFIGIDLENQLTLTDLSSNFRKYFLRKEDIHKAKTYLLKVEDARTAGRVIYELEGVGISNVDIDRTEYAKMDDLLLELKGKAVSKARNQAEAMAGPINQQVGKAIIISDIDSRGVSALASRAAGIIITGYTKNRQEYATIPIEFEKIRVVSEVKVTFMLN